MNQNHLIGAFMPLFLGIVSPGFSSAPVKEKLPVSKPNIIFILTDDHRTSAMGYAGNPIVQTPEMDKLAREGTYFRNAFASTPISAASRACIISGLYERTHKYTFQTEVSAPPMLTIRHPNSISMTRVQLIYIMTSLFPILI